MGWECSQGELALSPPGLFDLLHTYLSLSHLSTAWSCSGTGDSEVPAESAQVLFYFFFSWIFLSEQKGLKTLGECDTEFRKAQLCLV